MKHTIQEENLIKQLGATDREAKFIMKIMSNEEFSDTLKDIRFLLSSQLQSIFESLEKEKLLEVAVNSERLLQKQYYNKGIEKGRSIISNRMGKK